MFERSFQLFLKFLTDYELFVNYKDIVKRLFLSQKERDMIKYVEKFLEVFGKTPTFEELCIRYPECKNLQLRNIDDKVIREEFVSFIRNERVKEWILKVASKVDSREVVSIELFEEVSAIVREFEEKSKELVLVKDKVSSVMEKITKREENIAVKSGIKGLDKVLHGGFSKGEFACMIAPPGRGKTTFLINVAYGALVDRKNVLFVTMELSEEAIIGRFLRRVAGMSRKDLRVKGKEAEKIFKRFFDLAGKLSVVYEKPYELSVEKLRILVDKFEMNFGEKVDEIVLDYLDRMKVPYRDYRLGFMYLIDWLRDLGAEKQLTVVSATQANRASLGVSVVTAEYVAESFKKIESSDVVLSFNRSERDKGKGAARIVVLKNREYGGEGAVIPVKVDLDKMLIKDYVG